MIFSFFYPHLFDELRSLDRSFFVEKPEQQLENRAITLIDSAVIQ
jgi:hypothetical protein